MDLALQLLANGLANGSSYALLGIAWGLIFNVTGLAHFAFGPLYALGAYLIWASVTVCHLPLWIALPFGITATAVLGALCYLTMYRAFERRRSSPVAVMVASLGLFMVLENGIAMVFGTDVKVLPNVNMPIFVLGPVVLTAIQILQVACLTVVSLLLVAFLTRTQYGGAIVAMTDNPQMARIVGVNTERVSVVVFLLGTAISGICAGLMLLRDGALPHMGFGAVFTAFVAVFVGGVGSLRGAALAGLLLGVIENLGIIGLATEWQSSISFAVLLAILLVKPQGLFGRR